jgi:hypothetical protein
MRIGDTNRGFVAKLAEHLVEEWLNRDGYFTLRGLRLGVDEIDLLAIKPTAQGIEARHIEVQISFRPISYLGKLDKQEQLALGYKSASSAGERSKSVLEAGIDRWFEKKFSSKKKQVMREHAIEKAVWKFGFVHAKVHHPYELELIQKKGVELINFNAIVLDLCQKKDEFSTDAGTDISEIIRYCSVPTKAE